MGDLATPWGAVGVAPQPHDCATEYRVLVCGSRDFADRKVIRAFMRELTVRERFHPGERIVIVHGAARGVDRWAGEEAKVCGFEVEEHPAQWALHGKRAGLIRNQEMLASGCTRVVAFWDGKSRGTQHMIRIAREANARVMVVREGDADLEVVLNSHASRESRYASDEPRRRDSG